MIPYHLKQALAHDLHIPTKTQFPSYIYTNKLHLLIKYWGRETQACSPSAKSDSAKVKKQLPVSVQFISPPPPFFLICISRCCICMRRGSWWSKSERRGVAMGCDLGVVRHREELLLKRRWSFGLPLLFSFQRGSYRFWAKVIETWV